MVSDHEHLETTHYDPTCTIYFTNTHKVNYKHSKSQLCETPSRSIHKVNYGFKRGLCATPSNHWHLWHLHMKMVKNKSHMNCPSICRYISCSKQSTHTICISESLNFTNGSKKHFIATSEVIN